MLAPVFYFLGYTTQRHRQPFVFKMHRFSEPAKTVGEEEEETFGKEGKYITARSHLEEICGGGGGGNGRTATGTGRWPPQIPIGKR